MRFQAKVLLFFTLLFLLLLVQGIFFITHEQTIFQREMKEKGILLSENLAELSKAPIANYQFNRLLQQIESMEAKTDISYISIVNQRYLVLADTRRELEGWIYSGKLIDSTEVQFRQNEMLVQSPVFILGQLRGMVEISFGLQELNSKIRENVLVFSLFFLFELVVAGLFGILFEVQLVKPLYSLAQEVGDITADSLYQQIRVPRGSSIEIRRVAQALEQMKKNLKQAQDEIISKTEMATMGKISANFAHEIRNPLEAISGSVEIIGYDIEENSERAKYLGIMREEIATLNEYLENFLEFTRVQPVHWELIDLNTLIQDTLLLVRPLYTKKGILCETDLAEQILLCRVDTGQIKRVLLNIIINGIEAIEESQEHDRRYIAISSWQMDSMVLFECKDSGAGIKPEIRDKIFDPYFTTKTNGSGIGLSISKNIIEQHKGRISVQGETDKGSIIRITLPAYKAGENETNSSSG